MRRLPRPYESLSFSVALADGSAACPAEFQVRRLWFGIVYGSVGLIICRFGALRRAPVFGHA